MFKMNRGQQLVFIILIAALLIETGVLLYTGRAQRALNEDIVINAHDLKSIDTAALAQDDRSVRSENEQPQKIKVYVTGMVKKPGVYELEDGDRIEAAIDAAGGFTSDADISGINMAQRLKDEDMIYVPKIGEAAAPAAVQSAQSKDDKININTATAEELDQLPGIGPSKAKKIVDYRQQNGPFKAIEDIEKVSGIGPQTFENIKDFITVK